MRINVSMSGGGFSERHFRKMIEKKVRDKVESDLRGVRCRVHGSAPTIMPAGDGVDVRACCEEFRQDVIRILNR